MALKGEYPAPTKALTAPISGSVYSVADLDAEEEDTEDSEEETERDPETGTLD